jgi:hypothetical protein
MNEILTNDEFDWQTLFPSQLIIGSNFQTNKEDESACFGDQSQYSLVENGIWPNINTFQPLQSQAIHGTIDYSLSPIEPSNARGIGIHDQVSSPFALWTVSNDNSVTPPHSFGNQRSSFSPVSNPRNVKETNGSNFLQETCANSTGGTPQMDTAFDQTSPLHLASNISQQTLQVPRKYRCPKQRYCRSFSVKSELS